jgi:hypothetical protein
MIRLRISIVPILLCLLPVTVVMASGAVDFNREVRPVLYNKCVACHGPDEGKRKAKLRLDDRDAAIAKGAIVPGKRDESELWARITSTDEEEVMPPPEAGHALKPAEIEVLGRWIDAGAVYERHWSFIKPERATLPMIDDVAWSRSPIDRFLAADQAKEGIAHAPVADPYALIRRVSLDLTGLPPTPEEAEAFAKNPGLDAYEGVVDRLLADPAYGERWASMWLDLARYADSRGYGSDPLRVIWRYRDWVIDAFNRNLAYDQFTVEQLAGDLLPEPTSEQLLATAFHRNTLTNTLGGTIDEEFRVIAVKDRANTTAQVWMGLTMGCAQCHSHKFDPITQEEYYRFYAVFNQTEDSDQPNEYPTAPTPTLEEEKEMAALRERIAAVKSALARPTPAMVEAYQAWEVRMRGGEDWVTLDPLAMDSEAGATFAKEAEGEIFVNGKEAETDVYTLRARVPAELETLGSLRLEALADERFDHQGPGRKGNFVLNEIKVSVDPKGTAPRGRYVRIELPGKEKMLQLAEVEVVSGGKNVARGGTATQSSTDFGGAPERAIDGNEEGEFTAGSVSHTAVSESPWWEVDLGSEMEIDQVVVKPRTDGELFSRHDGYQLVLLDAGRVEMRRVVTPKASGDGETRTFTGPRQIPLRAASADYEQPDYGVALAIDGQEGGGPGWAVGQDVGRDHAAVFQFAAEQRIPKESEIVIVLEQRYAKHALGRFRLSVTSHQDARILSGDLAAILAKAEGERSEGESAKLWAAFFVDHPDSDPRAAQLAAMEKELAGYKPTVTPVMRELPKEKQRKTHILSKGNYLLPGDEVTPGVPAAFDAEGSSGSDRLAVARWLMNAENPLTARVAVNRFWAQLFGRGIVVTEEDFGTQGAYPNHPELLDWLAVTFREDLKWDMKALLKMLVMSEAYRQSAVVDQAKWEQDPDNRLLGRGPRVRLKAEMVRDQALAVSGLLSRKMHGESVFPPQPEGLWRAAFNGERNWATSMGEDRYRRGLYVFLRRSVPYPSMITFDAPNRELCTMRRIPTNTPLQAFVTLNDPAYVEMARAFAGRLVREGGSTPEERIRRGLRLCLLRPPADGQIAPLLDLFQSELIHYQSSPADAKALAIDSVTPVPEGVGIAELAAWTVVANVLLNLDGMMMK